MYVELLGAACGNGAPWVQLDEPAFVTGSSADLPALARRLRRAGQGDRPARTCVATYYGPPGSALAGLARTPWRRSGWTSSAAGTPGSPRCPSWDKTLVAGVVDGRNMWRTDLEAALAQLATLLGSAANLAVSTSCSALHVPYSLEPETGLDDALRGWLAFGRRRSPRW